MLEPNLSKRRTTSAAELSISFDDAAVGTQTFTDKGNGRRTFTRGVISGMPGGTQADGVYNHVTFGKVYIFNGYTYFNCPNVIQHNNRNYRLEIDFVPRNSTKSNVVWRSGDFTGYGPKSGVLLVLNQDPANYIQAFRCNGGSWQRSTHPSAYPGEVLEQLVITKNGDNYTILNKRTGISKTWNGLTITLDTYLAFGCADDLSATYAFIGYLKRCELFLL